MTEHLVRAAAKSAMHVDYHPHPTVPPRGDLYDGTVALRFGDPTELTMLLGAPYTPAEHATWLDNLAEQATRLTVQVRQAEAFASYGVSA